MNRLTQRGILLCVGLAFTSYAIAYIWQTSFVIDGERYFSLFDDAMVSMRYARNLADGHGLVWNPGGERIEGYTNLLWVVFMALLHFLPLPASKVSLLVQLAGLGTLLLNLLVVARLSRRLSDNSLLATGTATALTAFYLPLNTWGLQGMEVGLLALLVSTAALLACRCLDEGRMPPILYPLLGLATLVRLDAVVPFVTILGLLALLDRAARPTHLGIGLGTLAVALGGQTAFRWWYYGDLLPNTYYLKMTGYPVADRIGRGLLALGQFILRSVIGLILLLPALRHLPRDRRVALLLALIVMQAAYGVYVGGDAWEWAGANNRYLMIVMPLVFVLLGVGYGRFGRSLALGVPSRAGRAGVRVLLAAVTLLTVAALNTASWTEGWRAWTLREPPLHVRDNAGKVRLALGLRQITSEQATVAVVWAGAIPYFLERTTIDQLGKNDRVVAHLPMRQAPATAPWLRRLAHFYPGHLKYDYAYSIGRLEPDAVAELWRDQEEAVAPLAQAYCRFAMADTVVYLRSGSPEIRWERVARASRMPPSMVAGIPTCPAAATPHASGAQRDPGDISRVMAADSGTRYRYR